VGIIIFLKFKKHNTMATYEKGVLGSFSGACPQDSVSRNRVGSSLKGMSIMRSRNKKSSKKTTLKQLMQQAKFAFMTRDKK